MTDRFPRTLRVRARADFDRAFKQGRRTASPLFSLHYRAGEPPARLGLAVSRKVDPRAVGRNRIKRVLRDAFRRLRLPGGDYVLVARPPAAASDNAALRAELAGLLRRAGALPAPDADGTIPAAAPAAPPILSTSDARADRPSLPVR